MAQARHGKKKATRRASTRGNAAQEASTLWMRHQRDFWIVILFVVGIFVALSEVKLLGPAGHGLEKGLATVFGVGRVALPVILLGVGAGMLFGKLEAERVRFGAGLTLGLVGVSGLTNFIGKQPHFSSSTAELSKTGGWLGVAIGGGLKHGVGIAGALVVLAAVLLIAILVLTGVTLRSLVSALWSAPRFIGATIARWWAARPEREYDEDEYEDEDVPPAIEDYAPDVEFPVYVGDDEVEEAEEDEEEEYEEDEEEEYEEEDEYDDEEADEYEDIPPMALPRDAAPPILVQSEWELPNANVLLRTKEQRQDRLATEAAGEDLVAALAAHGVETTLLGYTIGPTVTRFELELGPGVKVARVTSLNKDIAYAMASPDVRILAPIPGRSAIGVEVPNRQRSLVALGDLLASEEAQSAVHPLDVPIGRDIAGRTVVVNLGAMPHILISGATGAGKSSCINSLITSLVMRATPDQLRLILVDPKRVELGQYNDLPHLLAPVVVDPKKAANTLNWAVREMERRYDILAANGVRDITSYQEAAARGELEAPMSTRAAVADVMERTTGLATELDEPTGPENLPYIVIVVDELNDLMMVAARDVEDSVVRIAQMARAVGIHLVLATQRPSVDVITGVIKANIPSRMAFAVSSLGDSRVILDQAGAERLIGKGDMLLLTASSNIARRLQSPWVSEDEVRKVVASWRAQGGRAETVVALDVPTGLSGSSASSGSDVDDDALLRQARELVIRSQSGSTSMLQRKMRIGFARAGRLMDMLEEEEVVAPGDGSKARKVLVTLEEYEQQQSSY